jgi:hypothetical protein
MTDTLQPFQSAFASGKGNSIWVSDGATAIIMDAGLPKIEIQRRMESRSQSTSDNEPFIFLIRNTA